MNVAFLANSFHLNKTKSTDFLIDLLREWYGSVTVIPHKEAWAKLPGRPWDLIVVFQKLWKPEELESFGAQRVVLVPMYDDCPKDRAFWEPYLGFKVLSFSKTLGRDLASWGFDCLSVQYYQPVPETSVSVDLEALRGFFWPRTPRLTWAQIRTLVSGTPWSSFHLHNPDRIEAFRPSPEDRERFCVTETDWFEKASDYQETLGRASVFFAPRDSEGIGQAVLEALGRGMCVVAPDAPTMNEYIRHGQNGILFDPARPEPLDFRRADELGVCARQSAIQGRKDWEASLPAIREFLTAGPVVRPPRFHLGIILGGRLTAFLRGLFRFVKRILGRA